MRIVKNNLLFFLSLTLLFVATPSSVKAEDVQVSSDNDMHTDLSVTIIRSPLYLSEVKAPIFGTYLITDKENQAIKPTSDLIIKIKDERDYKNNPWQLRYELSAFINDQNNTATPQPFQLKLGKGNLTSNGEKVATADYQNHEATIDPKNGNTLLQVSAVEKDYEYIVPKEDIQIELPKDAKVGTYTTTQRVILSDVPASN